MASPPDLEFILELRAEVGPPIELGATARGIRRIVPILKGSFEGPRLKGDLLPGGADWQAIRADGLAEIDARYTLRTENGALIYVSNVGMRHGPREVMDRLRSGEPVDPSSYYFRTSPVFETADLELQWLSKSIFIGAGERYPGRVVMRFWRVA